MTIPFYYRTHVFAHPLSPYRQSMRSAFSEMIIKVPKELTHGPFAVDTGSLMLPGLILFFLAQPKSQE